MTADSGCGGSGVRERAIFLRVTGIMPEVSVR